jgi:hypothetical protein
MWRVWMVVAVMVAVGLGVGVGVGWAGSRTARATPSAYTLCSTGAGKPFVSPVNGGKCKAGQKPLALASAGAMSSLKTQVASLKSRVSALEQKLIRVSYSASGLNHKPTLKISGANLQVVSGSGHTNGSVNGLGNVIIGYDEANGIQTTQTGSNNLVLGVGQSFSSHGDVIGGYDNTASGSYADVFGGGNTASALGASVSGGELNLASDGDASVVGGCKNVAGAGATLGGSCQSSGDEAILGGSFNAATGDVSSVSGGYHNQARGGAASILGGDTNTVSDGNNSSILGGNGNTVSGGCTTFPTTPKRCLA